ncbi:MAG: hypothetical protein ACI9JU_001589, partial [Pseudohongiellaceae bacterium]
GFKRITLPVEVIAFREGSVPFYYGI